MSNSARRALTIQTYCLRGFTDLRVVVRKISKLGIAQIELAGMHVGDAEPFAESGIGIVCTGGSSSQVI